MEWLDREEEPNSSWAEYVVKIKIPSNPESEVVLNIWAEGLQEALDCGEALSSIYL